jgi:hypothetical protein
MGVAGAAPISAEKIDPFGEMIGAQSADHLSEGLRLRKPLNMSAQYR